MIVFIYGTTAEAIKIAPIARRLEARGIPYESWVTFQHTDSLRAVIPQLGLRPPARVIADGDRGRPLTSSRQVVGWLRTVLRWLRRHRRELRRELPAGSIVVVHGDTLTTVLGAWIARRLGVPSAHVEAGLRSGNWRHPFPEELDRRIVGRLATIHYAPSTEAVEHLAGRRNVVHTHGNTIIDAVLDHGGVPDGDGDPYGVALLHRFEFISNAPLVESTFATLAERSPHPVRLLTDVFSGHGLRDVLAAPGRDRIRPQPKLRHDEFIAMLRGAAFVVTDSGGVQAEAALLGVPTLVHRRTTEQQEGVGENIVLSGWDVERLAEFLADPERHRRAPGRPAISPSDVIVDDLIARGHG